MDFDNFLDQAWTDHATQAAAVAMRLQCEGLALLKDEAHVGALAFLAQHVHGQHLGRWDEGVVFQQRLAALPLVVPGSTPAQNTQRFQRVLRLAGGLGDDRPGSSDTSERLRITAMAAAALTVHDAARARALLVEASEGVEAAALADDDPAVRALAAAGNNIAGALEEEATLDEAARRLMILGAETGRHFWARAGNWLEVERAEYRLAMSWLRAGKPGHAATHARQCLALVQAQPEPGAPALEHFFAWEAVGRAEHAAGHSADHAQALQQAEVWFAQLGAADVAWCRNSLQALRALAAPC